MHANRHTRGQRWLAWVMAVVLCLGLLPGAALAAEPTVASDLFISEYVEGSGSNKAVEIYNGTGVEVDLSQYTLVMVNFSGSGMPTKDASEKSMSLTGTLGNGETFVYYNSGINSELTLVKNKDSNNTVINFNGNDYVYLKKDDTVIDVIGGTSTNMNDYSYSGAFAADCTLVRNADVTGPSATYQENQWTDQGKDVLTGLGAHTMTGSSDPGEGGDTTVAAPQADPQAGAVASGTEITLTCATADAQIYYTLDGGEPTADSALYSDASKPTITGEAGASVTLKAIAVLGENQSAVQTLTYTIKEEEYIYNQITELDELLAGGNFVFAVEIAEGKYRAIGSEFNYQDYLEDVEATVEDGVLTFGEDMQIFTVSAINGQDNKVSLSSEGKYLYSGQYQPTLSWSTTQYGWLASASESENGTFRLSSPSNANRYLSWRGDPYGKFGANVLSSSNVDTYIGDLLVFRQEEKTETNAPIAAGDQVVIYAPAYNKALSSEKTGFYNVGTDITVSEGTVSGYGENDVWTVVDNGDNTYSFQQNGRNIGLGESYASMDLGAVNDDWELIDLGNGRYNIRNTVRDNYMEWYAQYSNWSTYNSSSAATDDRFQLSFYKVTGETPEPEPEAPIESGDTVVIYAPSNHMALSATVKNSYYPIGVKVAVEGGTLTGYSATEVWTVGGKDGAWTFTSNSGKTLSMAGSYSSVYPGAGENETWVLEAGDTEGQYYVKNAGRGTYMFWDDEHDDWTTRNGEKTAVSFRVVEPPEEEPDVTGLEVRATPASGASVKAGDTIELTAAAGAEIYYTTDGTAPTKNSTHYESPITLGSGEGQVPAPTDDKSLVIKAISVATNEEGEEEIGDVCTFTYQAPVTLNGYNLYFGQLHSHTDISDGAGSVTEAFTHAAGVANLDFLAVTDHSNSFDNESDSQVDLGTDLTNVSNEWKEGHQAAKDATTDDFVGIYGFEMTWSDGFGHINTFNTPGFESRSNSEFGNKSGSTEGYQNYYKKLVEVEDSLSQFNHPGTTFGDFQDFAFYDPQVDQRITLIEVGNGEGAIGSSGYFPSYEYYTRALDKGWHVAPTNNQDNHKGNWGDSNTARSVVLASDLTEEGIYDAIRNYRVYATEDNDLSILYDLNGNAMGSILSKQDAVEITAQISDPTDTADMKVEVIVNGGLVLDSQTLTDGKGTVTFTFDSNDYSYYYLRVTQADQNIAVTAPVWTGEGVNAGISKTECDTALVVKGEAVTISSELYNNAGSDMTVKSLTFSVDGIEKPIYTANVSQIGTNGVIYSGGSYTVSFPYAFTQAGKATVDVSMTATIGETEYTFAGVLQLTVTDESLVTRVLVDGTHYNDYVTGYYSGNMGNFTQLAAGMNAQVTIQQPGDEITAEDLEDVSLLVISAPIKYEQNGIEATEENRFSNEFIDTVEAYVQDGGTVIVCGLADYQDGNEPGNNNEYTTYGQINKLLEGIGSTMKVNDDELIDQDENGGQAYRLYFDDFNYDSADEAVQAALAGLEGSDKVYSSYSGCSVNVGDGEAIVFGHDTTYSINSKAPAQGHDKPVLSASAAYDPNTAVVQKSDVVSLATEAVGSGRVYLGGTVWMSDFEVKSDGSNGSDYGDASYANKTIISNILSGLLKEPEVSTIAQVRENTTVGAVFTVEGTVTAGNVEPNAFYDTIYIQDATGGINIYPVATTDGTFQVGQKVRVTGSWDQYQGDTELRCIRIERISEAVDPIDPAELSITEAADYDANGGLLAEVSGTVKSVTEEGDAISSVILTDGTTDFRLLFNNYIGYSDKSSPDITTFVKEGAEISAVGVIYKDPEGVCLRVRDLSEVERVEDEPSEPENPDVPEDPDVPVNPNPSYAITVEQPDHGTVTVTPNRATQGAAVTITATPDRGYQVNAVTVTDRFGDAVQVTENADGTYTFTMPNGQVTITATFVETEEPVGEPFLDVNEGDWFYDAVAYAYENGLMDGVGGNRFAPNSETTRAQLVTILYRLEGQPAVSGDLPFTDVEAGTWYTNAVGWAAQNGIVNGVGDDTFAPGNDLTREQLVTILYRYAESKGYDVSASADLAGYPDGEAIQAYAREAMAWAVAENIIRGMEDDTLKPAGNASRAQIATILMRFCEGVAG